MAAPKGHKRYGGRTKGIPNKSTQTLIEKCEAYNIDVFEAMLKIASEATVPFEKFGYLKEIAQYILPKRKALEVDATVNMDLAKKAQEYSEIPIIEQIHLLRSEAERLELELLESRKK